MSDPSSHPLQPVDPSVYNRDYFLTECEGYDRFAVPEGQLSRRLLEAIQRVKIRPGANVLDIGCGRGEIVAVSWGQGALAYGIDYSAAAIEIARSYLRARGVNERAVVLPANAKHLPFPDAKFDVVFMLDIIEHLHAWELEQALGQVHRVLRQEGVLFAHTAPNLWYYRFGYPAYRALRQLQGERLPRNPKDRFKSHQIVHVNEQSAISLRHVLDRAGFTSRIWVDQSQDRLAANDKRWIRLLADFVTRNFIFKWIFCGDIYAIARKEGR